MAPKGIKAAMRAGVKAIEHASLIDDEGIAMAKAKGVWLDMDIYDGDYIADYGRAHHWPADMLRKNDETTQAQRDGFAKAVKAGVKLAFGTDAGVYPHGLNARQFKYMVRYGMTPMQAIQAATTVRPTCSAGARTSARSARPLCRHDRRRGDPLADISILEHVDHVIKGGQEVR
jgi:imidazolonepropionase-like amidohydrolase